MSNHPASVGFSSLVFEMPKKQRRPQWSRADFCCMSVARRRYIWLSGNDAPTRDCYVTLALTRHRKQRQVHFESLLYSYAGLALFIARRHRRPPQSDKSFLPFAQMLQVTTTTCIKYDTRNELTHGYMQNSSGTPHSVQLTSPKHFSQPSADLAGLLFTSHCNCDRQQRAVHVCLPRDALSYTTRPSCRVTATTVTLHR
jgi:hypothetical protein